MNAPKIDPYDDEPASGFINGSGSIELLRGGAGFSGAISLPLLPDLIQIYTISLANGALSIRRGTDIGTIWFERGEMAHAVCGDIIGEEAVYQLLQWRSGYFSLDGDARPPMRSITASWQTLLMEGCRRLDEGATEDPAILEKLERVLDGFIGGAVLNDDGSVLVRRTKGTLLDYSTAGLLIAEFVRNAARNATFLDSVFSAGDTLHYIKPISGERVLHLAVERGSFNVAVIRRAVDSVAARFISGPY